MVIGILGEVLFLTSSDVVATPNSFKKTSESLFTDHQGDRGRPPFRIYRAQAGDI